MNLEVVGKMDLNSKTTLPKQRGAVCLPSLGAVVCCLLASGCSNGANQRASIERAQSQVARIAEDLDGRTTESGVYIRAEKDEIKERDPWGTPVKVTYSQGGVAETLSVRSAGPDRTFQTQDDIFAQGMAANLKGIGEGIKKNAEETAANAAKGVVKGAVTGVKESIKDALPSRNKKRVSDEQQEEEQ